MQNILVTGGLGYIGSHTCIALNEAGYNPIIVDNCSNSSLDSLDRISKILGFKPHHYLVDVADTQALAQVFDKHIIHGVIHFAAFKAVGESVKEPLKYYRNNIDGLLSLLEVMTAKQISNLIFSSSCSLYGDAKVQPVNENTPLEKPQSPYAHTKKVGEEILESVCVSNSNFKVISLRYFNPVGAHKSAIIGEVPKGVPSNLLPFITQSAAGILGPLTIYGNDYHTPDGTCIRDYIHVMDLAEAHVLSLHRLISNQSEGNYELFNIGTGKGSSVLECVETFEVVTSVRVKYSIGNRREGDIEKVWADNRKAREVLGWNPKYDLQEMLRSAWQWQINMNVEGIQ